MEIVFTLIKYLFLGFFGLLGLLIVAALIFGDRIVKKWDYEAEFRNEDGREFGEFDIEMSKIEKKEAEYSLKAKFRMRHEKLALHSTVQVFLDDLLVLEGMVKNAGRILLTKENLQIEVTDAEAGQLCRIVCGGNELFAEELVPD